MLFVVVVVLDAVNSGVKDKFNEDASTVVPIVAMDNAPMDNA